MRNNFPRKRAQQEIAGFVLIVVLVIVGMMVFLVISLRGHPESQNSVEAGYLLDAIMKQTTGCAIVYEPNYDTFEDLFKHCYEGDRCKNLDVSACDYLNDSLGDVLKTVFAYESDANAYQLDFFDENNSEGILQIRGGNCTGDVVSAERKINELKIRIKICKD